MLRLTQLIFLLFLTGWAMAQPSLERPTYVLERQKASFQGEGLRLEELPQTSAEFPFFDNFLYNSSMSYGTFWDSSGVKISLGFAPKYLVFNGLNVNNRPYDSAGTVKVAIDSVVSKPMDLSKAAAISGVYLQFEWQGGGTGTIPKPAEGDAFEAYAFDPIASSWNKIWQAPAVFDPAQVNKVRIPLDAVYLNSGFRLMFKSYGLPNAGAGQWLLYSVEISGTTTLPLWEDFSDLSTFDQRFKTNTGVYINNHMAVDAPSFNVATFDGLDDLGAPYFTTNNFQTGTADSLVSQAIDLTGFQPSDSLRMGFLWQNAGFGEVSDQIEGDSIVLQFYGKNGFWKSVWQSPLGDTSIRNNKFYPGLITVRDTQFFHEGFKFKFVNYAKLSGMYDVWNIDYIAIDTIRGAGNTTRGISNGRMSFSDLAISKTPTSIVYPYYAIPSNHLHTEAFQFAPNFTFSVSNLGQFDPAGSPQYTITRQSGTDAKSISGTGTTFVNTPFGVQTIVQEFDSSPLQGPVTESEFQIVHKVYIEQVPGSIGNYAFDKNDTLTTVFPFKDYYSYDDGTYEYAVNLKQEDATHALKFTTYIEDTLKFVDVCIPYNGYNLTGNRVHLKVWLPDASGRPGAEVYTKAKYVQYSKGRNPFTRFALDKTVVLPKGDFFVGIKQDNGNTRALRIGFDINNDTKDRYWFDNAQGAGWSQFKNPTGTVMMRAVFQDGPIDLAEPETVVLRKEWSLEFFPNPNSQSISGGLLSLNNVYDKVEVVDFVRSKVLLSVQYTDQVDISTLESGMYVVRARLDGQTKTKKLVFQR